MERKTLVIKTLKEHDMESEDEEDVADYRQGGYHPVEPGDIFNKKYQIAAKLGWGHFSTVWLAKNLSDSGHRDVALKVVKSASHYTDAARDEISILKRSTMADPADQHCVLQLLDHFDFLGPNGNHVVMVFERLGCNLLSIIRLYRHRGLPVPLVRMITKQLIVGMEFLHKCQIIHTDLKPENILFVRTPKIVNNDPNKHAEGLPWEESQLRETFSAGAWKIKIVDLGNACWTYHHYTDDVQTRQYRAPEVILGAGYNEAIDVWSMACIVFELLTGDLLFAPKNGRSFDKNDDHLAQMTELLGKLPLQLALGGKHSNDFYDARGELRQIKNLNFWPLKNVLTEKYRFADQTSSEICNFLEPMLVLNPIDRITAPQCLRNPWIRDIDINDFGSVFKRI